MKKIIVLMLSLSPFLFSCGNGGEERDPIKDSLTAVTHDLGGQVEEKDSTIISFVRSFNEIQDNLAVIKEKEKMLNAASKDAEMQKSQKDQIVEDIQLIYDLMAKNKQKIGYMNAKLLKANHKIEDLDKMIARLTNDLADREIEIGDLKSQLEKLNLELANITINLEEEKQVSQVKTDKLNTAYYAFGTSKELIKQGVLTKEGGFIGIGKAEKLKNDFNKSYFTKVDITQTTSITLGVKKAKFITTHPTSAYKLDGTKDRIEKISITNPEEFWSSSKYLVIVVD